MSHCTCEKDVIVLYFSVPVLLFFENRILRATYTFRVSDYVIESRDFWDRNLAPCAFFFSIVWNRFFKSRKSGDFSITFYNNFFGSSGNIVSHYFSHALLFTFISFENLMQVFKFDNAEKDYFIGVSSRAFGTMEYTALGKNSQFSEGLECSFSRTF